MSLFNTQYKLLYRNLAHQVNVYRVNFEVVAKVYIDFQNVGWNLKFLKRWPNFGFTF